MAVSGTFTADFASFFDACDKAQVSLRGFEASTSKVESSLNRLVDNFSGRKVISEATEMAKAVELIGGVSKLTAAELEKIGRVVGEASDKLRAWGQDVPASFTKVTDAAKASHAELDKTKESVGLLGEASTYVTKALAGMFTAEAVFEGFKRFAEGIIEVTRSVMEYSIQLRNLSLQTQIPIETLQTLGAAVKDFGVDADQLGKAIFQLGRRIAGGDESAANALHMFGLSVKEVRGLSPEELFLTIERSIAKVPNALSTSTAASELFGARLGASLIAASYNLDETLDEIKKLNVVMSADAVHAAAEFSESVDHLKLSLLAMAGNALQPAMTMLDRFTTNLSTSKGRVEDLKIALIALASQGFPQGIWDALFTPIAKPGKDINLPTDAPKGVDPEQFMLALKKDTLDKLTAVQLTYLGQLREMGQLNEKNAAAIGVTVGQFKNYQQSLVDAKKAHEDLAKAQAAADALAMTHYAETLKGLQEQEKAKLTAYDFHAQVAAIFELDAAEQALARSVYESLTSEKDRAKVVADSVNQHIALMDKEAAVQLKQAGLVNAAILAEFEAQVKLNDAWGLDAAGAIKVQRTALDTLNIALAELHLKKVDGISQIKEEQVLLDAYTKRVYDEAVAQGVVATATESSATRQIAAINGVTKSFYAQIDAMAVAQMAKDALYGVVGTRPPSVFDAPVSKTGFNLGGPFTLTPPVVSSHAFGGPTQAGLSMLHDDEYVVPKDGALVLRGGSGIVVNNTFHIVDTADNIARRTADLILRTVRQQTKLSA